MAATSRRITKHTGAAGLSVAVSVSKTFGNEAFKTTAVKPRQQTAEKVMRAAIIWIDKNAPRDRGHLRKSFDQGKNGTKIVVDGRNVRLTVSTNVGYGAALDSGKRRRAGGIPPPANILRWMRRVGINGDIRVAGAIARGIGARGVQSGPSFVSGKQRGRPTKGWTDGLVRAVRDEFNRLKQDMVDATVREILGKS